MQVVVLIIIIIIITDMYSAFRSEDTEAHHQCSKFEVRRPCHLEDMAHNVCEH